MNKLLIGLVILSILIVSGCQGVDVSKISSEDMGRIAEKAIVCNEPYIRFGTGCCLDKNKNNICDDDERELKQESSQEAQESTKSTTPLKDKVVEADKTVQNVAPSPTYIEEAEAENIPDEVSQKGYDLSDFPLMFKYNGGFDGFIVIGQAGTAKETEAMNAVVSSLSEKYGLSELNVNALKLDYEIKNNLALDSVNLILIGTPCSNTLVQEVFGTSDCHAYLSEGEALIKLFQNGNKYILLITGYNDETILGASNKLAQGKEFLSGNDIRIDKNGQIIPVATEVAIPE